MHLRTRNVPRARLRAQPQASEAAALGTRMLGRGCRLWLTLDWSLETITSSVGMTIDVTLPSRAESTLTSPLSKKSKSRDGSPRWKITSPAAYETGLIRGKTSIWKSGSSCWAKSGSFASVSFKT